MRTFILLLGASILAFALPAAAGATPSTPVTIHTDILFNLPCCAGGTHGTFTSAAPLCPSGIVVGTIQTGGGAFAGGHSSGRPHTTIGVATVVEHFTCADGSGTFDIQLHPKGDVTTLVQSGPWAVLSGTGAYSQLHGTGDFTAIFPPGKFLIEVFETFTGQVHFD
jgi:hypothetical protein